MQRVAFISLFDELCHPLRQASSLLQQDGHSVNLLLVKGVEYASPELVPDSKNREVGGYYGFLSWMTPREIHLLLDLLKKQDPHLIGFYVSPAHFGLAAHLARLIQDELKKPVLWCGVDPTYNSEEAIRIADMICMGECEAACLDVVRTMDRGGDLTTIANLWCRKNDQLYRNPPRPLLQNLGSLPYADFETAHKVVICDDQICPSPFPPKSPLHTHFITRTGRGCPFACAYYFNGLDDSLYAESRAFRRRPVAHVIEEIKYRTRTWPSTLQHVEFHDGVLPFDKGWMETFAEEYGSEIGLPFSGFIHPTAADFSVIPHLCYYGLNYLILPVLSGSARTIQAYYDGHSPREAILPCAQNVQNAGIHLVVQVAGYNPLETEEDNLETLRLILDLPKPFGMKQVIPMAFYDHFPLTEKALSAGVGDQLERPEGVHALHARPNPLHVFYELLFTLAHFSNFTKEYILQFTGDEHLREHPAIFEEYIRNMYNATYHEGNPLLPKDEFVGHLRWKISQLEQSPVYRAFHKVRSLVR